MVKVRAIFSAVPTSRPTQVATPTTAAQQRGVLDTHCCLAACQGNQFAGFLESFLNLMVLGTRLRLFPGTQRQRALLQEFSARQACGAGVESHKTRTT